MKDLGHLGLAQWIMCSSISGCIPDGPGWLCCCAQQMSELILVCAAHHILSSPQQLSPHCHIIKQACVFSKSVACRMCVTAYQQALDEHGLHSTSRICAVCMHVQPDWVPANREERLGVLIQARFASPMVWIAHSAMQSGVAMCTSAVNSL